MNKQMWCAECQEHTEHEAECLACTSSASPACSIAPWISVDDRLPDTGFAPDWASSLDVLVWTDLCEDAEDVGIAYYHDDGKWRGTDLQEGETVTHWMPKPKGPAQ